MLMRLNRVNFLLLSTVSNNGSCLMLIIHNVSELREQLAGWKKQGETIAFVPTMGNLHDGHLALVKTAKLRAARTIVSIFVNPLQFSPDEDFSTYPRTLAEDVNKLTDYSVDMVFSPATETVYPSGEQQSTFIEVPGLSSMLEGAFRPGFFNGVATIVNKLFNIVQPDIALFGEKDYQQLLVIRQMVTDLNMPVQIQSVPTVREQDGLAMSSRNRYLDISQRGKSTLIYRSMLTLRGLVQQGMAFSAAEQQITEQLTQQSFEVDYLTICQSEDLGKPEFDSKAGYSQAKNDNNNLLIILVAARLGQTRLIDNLRFNLKVIDR